MSDYDGKIQLAMDVSPEDAIKSFKKLQTDAQKIFDSLSTDKLTKSEEKSLSAMSKLLSRGEQVAKQVEKFSAPVETKEYSKLAREYEKIAQKIGDAERKQQEFLDTGGKETSKTYQNMTSQISLMKYDLEEVGTELDRVVAEGRQFSIDETSLERSKEALMDISNQLLLQNQASMDVKAKRSEEAAALAAQAQRLLEIRANAGEINEEVGETINRIQEISGQLEQLKARQAELEQAGVGLGYKEYDQNLAKIRELEEELSNLKQSLRDYREEQENAQPKATEWTRVGNLFQQMAQDLAHPIQAFQRMREQMEASGQETESFAQKFSRLKSVIGSIALSKLKSGLSGLTSKFKHAGNAASNFAKKLNFGRILSYAIGIRGLFSIFTHLRTAVMSGISTMSKFNNGMNSVNSSMTQLTSSLNLVKGALATAFAPILTYVSPLLSSLMQQLAGVITYVGMFIAKLTGAKSYMKATFKSTDYANSLKSGGGSGKSAQQKYEEAVKKAQEKYDKEVAKVTQRNEKAEAKAAEKNTENQAKADEKQAKAADKLAKAQEKANNKLATFDDLNVLGAEDTEDATDALEGLEEVQADLSDMPTLELPDLEDFLGGGGGSSDNLFGLEEVPLDGIEWNWDDLLAKAEELGRKFADILNDTFSDEALAKDIGNAIGNLINMAIRFAYGFVDQFNFFQFGRWLGVLLTEGIETIDWGLLGETLGIGLNGLADSVIGFFTAYPAGLMGDSMAQMLNRAIDSIDAGLLGDALNILLKEPFIELSSFLTEANWAQVGEKFTTFFHNAITGTGFNKMTLGETIGQALADAVNAGAALLLGADVKQFITDLTTFFGDIIRKALLGVDWPTIFEALWYVIMGSLTGFVQGLITFLTDIILDALEVFYPQAKGKIEAMRTNIHASIEEACDDALAVLTGTMDEMENQADRFDSAIADMIDYMTDWSSGAAVDWAQALINIQEQHKLTDEEMENLIETFGTMDEEFNNSSEILTGYTGNWAEYKATLEGTNPSVDTAKEKQNELGNALEGVGTTAEQTGGKVKDYVKIAADEMATGSENAEAYEQRTVDALQGISDKSDEVVISFDTLQEQLGAELESLTTLIDEWYQNMITTYFGYDAWYNLLTEGILLAMNEVLTVAFIEMWDIDMAAWWQDHVITWVANDKWEAEIYKPWETYRDSKWKALMDWWTKMMTEWWNSKVVPWFQESKWKEQFEHIYKAATSVGEKTKNKITSFAEETKQAVIQACEEMIAKIQEVISALGEAIALASEMSSGGVGGGGGSSSGGGGTKSSSGGGGSRARGFMAMPDIMHFEDNLNMSAFKFPELATGAVIPPNNRFLAVLGDQPSGMNIETPLATMIEAFRSVMDEYMGVGNNSAVMEVDGETFARLIMPHIMGEANRLGYNTEIIEGM